MSCVRTVLLIDHMYSLRKWASRAYGKSPPSSEKNPRDIPKSGFQIAQVLTCKHTVLLTLKRNVFHTLSVSFSLQITFSLANGPRSLKSPSAGEGATATVIIPYTPMVRSVNSI